MSLYNSGIQLLPRPDRSVFSYGSDITRATIPDFGSVAELSEFTNRLINWHLHTPHIYAHGIFCCSVIFLLIIVIGLIMARRIYEAKFWLVRTLLRPSGVILVPNPTLAFLVMAFVCIINFAPWFLVVIRQYVSHTAPPRNLVLWFTLPWLPLSYGLLWATIGTYFATPCALLSPLDESKLSPISRFFRRANVINSLSLVIPIAMAVAVIVPSVISNRQWERALAMERSWQAQYASLPTFTQPMVQETQIIWYELLNAAKIAVAVFIMWTIFAFTMSMTYFYVSINLVIAVHQDLARAKHLERSQVQAVEEAEPIKASEAVSQIVVDSLQANQRPRTPRNQQDGLLTSSFQVRSALHYDLPTTENEVFAVNETASPAHGHRHDLSQALFQIYVQLLGIGPAAAAFGFISLTFALILHSKLEQPSSDGGNQFEEYIGGIWMTLLYLMCGAGCLNIFSVFWKTYVPVFVTHHRQAARPINFQDIAKGPAHIKSTFFKANSIKANTPSLPMSPPSSPAKGHAKVLGGTDAIVRLEDDVTGGQSWDIEEGGPSYHSTNSWPSPSSVSKLLH